MPHALRETLAHRGGLLARYDRGMTAPTEMRIVITRPLPGDAVARVTAAGFRDIIHQRDDAQMERQALLRAIEGAHGVLTTPVDRVDAEFFDRAGPQLIIVSNYAVGYDNIDIAEAKRRNVIVGHTPNAVTEPTADIAWLLLLGAARRATEGSDLVRSGHWKGVGPNELLGTSIVGKTLLIVGAGRIGHAVARRSVGWKMKVLYHARSRHPEFERPPIDAARVSLEDGLAAADFVSIHTPLSDETHHLIDGKRLSMMKPGAILVNTARGAVVDERALYEALRDGGIRAAGLDVYEDEPKIHPGLTDLPSVFALPHLGSATEEDRQWMMRLAVDNLIAALTGRPVPHRVA